MSILGYRERRCAAVDGGDIKVFDWWSLVHLSFGVAVAYFVPSMPVGIVAVIVLAILWEAIEPLVWPDWCESDSNSIMDIAIALFGAFITYGLR